jgi:hypothetical protein
MVQETNNIDTAIKATKKSVVSREKEIGEEAERPKGPVGLDIGTTHIIMAQNQGRNINTVKQLNAFFTIPASKFTHKILVENEVNFFEKDKQFYILGFSAESFAYMFNTNTRRSMEKGVLSAVEDEGVNILHSLIDTLITKAGKKDEVICFSIPGETFGNTNSVIYHESVIKMYLEGLGYKPISINEGLATIMSELANDNFTGIGISMGGGMCNVCLAYLSVPIISFSIQKGGDYIDSMVGVSVGEPATAIKLIKENELKLASGSKNRVHNALNIYYEDLIYTLLNTLQSVLMSTDKVPKISKPIPMILSGGTVIPKGFSEMFNTILSQINLPIEISEVRIAEDPLNTTAKGAMVMALAEEL